MCPFQSWYGLRFLRGPILTSRNYAVWEGAIELAPRSKDSIYREIHIGETACPTEPGLYPTDFDNIQQSIHGSFSNANFTSHSTTHASCTARRLQIETCQYCSRHSVVCEQRSIRASSSRARNHLAGARWQPGKGIRNGGPAESVHGHEPLWWRDLDSVRRQNRCDTFPHGEASLIPSFAWKCLLTSSIVASTSGKDIRYQLLPE